MWFAADEWPAVPAPSTTVEAWRWPHGVDRSGAVRVDGTVWATALAQSDGFRNMRMILVFLVAMVASMAGLGYALRELPVGTAYAVWTGIGAVGTALFGIAFLGEPASVGRIVCLALIVSGIVGLKLFS